MLNKSNKLYLYHHLLWIRKASKAMLFQQKTLTSAYIGSINWTSLSTMCTAHYNKCTKVQKSHRHCPLYLYFHYFTCK